MFFSEQIRRNRVQQHTPARERELRRFVSVREGGSAESCGARKMRAEGIGLTLALGAGSLATAGFMAETKMLQQPLYARASADACPKLTMSRASLLAVLKTRDAEGQASVARKNNM